MGQNYTSYQMVAEKALQAYGLAWQSLEFIRHSDAIAYRVRDSRSKKYLLRLHIPITLEMDGHGADPSAVRSGLTWLEALCRDTDLILQQPQPNLEGDLVTVIQAEDAQSINCSLLSWLEGVPYTHDLESADTAHQIGMILAKLHQHAAGWVLPKGFHRSRRDEDYFWRMLRSLQPAVIDGRIQETDYHVMECSIDRLTGKMAEWGMQRWGILHADTHKGNMLLDYGRIRLIDFSFCAFGHNWFDMGIALADMNQDLIQACLEGYRVLNDLSAGWQECIEGLFVGSMVGTFSYWVNNPAAQEILQRKVPHIVQEYAIKYNHGERFWFK